MAIMLYKQFIVRKIVRHKKCAIITIIFKFGGKYVFKFMRTIIAFCGEF